MGAAAVATALAAMAPAQAQEVFRIGVVSFLSGQAAESFGVPAVNGGKVLIDAFNKGEAPAPYNKSESSVVAQPSTPLREAEPPSAPRRSSQQATP